MRNDGGIALYFRLYLSWMAMANGPFVITKGPLVKPRGIYA